jgi:DNA invertase Pin-like site-specific DNA recombinase
LAIIGYARVSTFSQDLSRQTDALTSAGCEHIYAEHTSSDPTRRKRKADRETGYPPQLMTALGALRPGDTLAVLDLDRLTRGGLAATFTLIEELTARGIHIRILSLAVDTGSPGGEMALAVMSVIAKQERERLRRRTVEGLEAARRRGRVGGRPRAIRDEHDLARITQHVSAHPEKPIRALARDLKISVATLYRYLPAIRSNNDFKDVPAV